MCVYMCVNLQYIDTYLIFRKLLQIKMAKISIYKIPKHFTIQTVITKKR